MRSGQEAWSAGVKMGFMVMYMGGLDYRMRKSESGLSVLACFKRFRQELVDNFAAADIVPALRCNHYHHDCNMTITSSN